MELRVRTGQWGEVRRVREAVVADNRQVVEVIKGVGGIQEKRGPSQEHCMLVLCLQPPAPLPATAPPWLGQSPAPEGLGFRGSHRVTQRHKMRSSGQRVHAYIIQCGHDIAAILTVLHTPSSKDKGFIM